MMVLATQVSTVVKADRGKAFAHIVPIDLASIFTGYGPLPAVTGTTDQVGGWDEAGQTRTVELSDGSTAREKMNKYREPEYFSYTVSEFSGFLRFLATSADGEWWFESRGQGETFISWRYAFNSRSLLAVPVLWFISNVLWRGYMRKALSSAKRQLEVNAV